MFMYKQPGTGQVVGRHYCSHEVPPGWFQGRTTNLWNPSGQPVKVVDSCQGFCKVPL